MNYKLIAKHNIHNFFKITIFKNRMYMTYKNIQITDIELYTLTFHQY